MELVRQKVEQSYSEDGTLDGRFRIYAVDGDTTFWHFDTAEKAIAWAREHDTCDLGGVEAIGMEENESDTASPDWHEWYDDRGCDLEECMAEAPTEGESLQSTLNRI